MKTVNKIKTDLNNMIFEENRLRTFKNWPFNNSCNCSKKNMAEAGFYLLANDDCEADTVQCFYCGKQLDGWEDSDDPWKEHYSHAPYCNFAKLKKPESQLTVEEFLDFHFYATKKQINKVADEKKAELQSIMKECSKKYKRCFRKIKN